MTQETTIFIKNITYFILSFIVSIGLALAIILILSIQLWTKEFWLFIAFACACNFAGHRTANLSKPFNISEYFQRKSPIELHLLAIEALHWESIKRKRETTEEKARMLELESKMKQIESNTDIIIKEVKK